MMVTIAEKSGSSPRGVGSKMFVEPSGHIEGSIGGGKVEFEAINHCPEVKDKGSEALRPHRRRQRQPWDDLRRPGNGGIRAWCKQFPSLRTCIFCNNTVY